MNVKLSLTYFGKGPVAFVSRDSRSGAPNGRGPRFLEPAEPPIATPLSRSLADVQLNYMRKGPSRGQTLAHAKKFCAKEITFSSILGPTALFSATEDLSSPISNHCLFWTKFWHLAIFFLQRTFCFCGSCFLVSVAFK